MATPIAGKLLIALKNKKTRQFLLYTLAGFIVMAALLPAIILSSVKSLVGNHISQNFDITTTSIYSYIQPVYKRYISEITEEMEQMAQATEEEHAEWVDNGDGYEELVYRVHADVITNQTSLAPLFAYLSSSGIKSFTNSNDFPPEDEIIDFLRKTSKITETWNSDTSVTYQNIYLSEEEIAKIYFAEDTVKSSLFESSVKNFKFFFMKGTAPIYAGDFKMEYPPNGMQIPVIHQSDFGNIKFGGGTIATSGCSVTAMAMVFSYLGTQVSPADIAGYVGYKFYDPQYGQKWEIFPYCSTYYGFDCEMIGASQVVKSLSEGRPVIASMKSGTFTSGGHFIVLRGVDAEGNIYVNDPNDSAKKNFINRAFPLSLITSEAKGYWAFSKS